MQSDLSLHRAMLLVRRFEERLLTEFSSGRLVGTTHVYIGQEANAAGIFAAVAPGDVVFSNHRCHGHFLAYGGDPYPLAAELMGRSTGLVGGRGGSQHIHWRDFYSNGIQGGIVPVATGMALAEKAQGTGRVVLAFIGDGTLGEGVLYESLNMASLWDLPLLVVVEDNRIAQTTPVDQAVAGSMAERFSAFGLSVWERDTADVREVLSVADEALRHIRSTSRPACLLLHTWRFSAHSKGDDTRSAEQVACLHRFDPLSLHAPRLSTHELEVTEQEVASLVDSAFARAAADPLPALDLEGRG